MRAHRVYRRIIPQRHYKREVEEQVARPPGHDKRIAMHENRVALEYTVAARMADGMMSRFRAQMRQRRLALLALMIKRPRRVSELHDGTKAARAATRNALRHPWFKKLSYACYTASASGRR